MKDKHIAKSIIVGRKKREAKDKEKDSLNRPCFVSLFDTNDPHKKNLEPLEILDFEGVHKIILSEMNIDYLLAGNDLVINDLEFIEIEKDSVGHLIINGKQKK